MLLNPARWFDAPDELQTPLGHIVLFGSEYADGELSTLTEPQYLSLQNKIEPAAREIHSYWLKRRTPLTNHTLVRSAKILPFTAAPKTGRNALGTRSSGLPALVIHTRPSC